MIMTLGKFPEVKVRPNNVTRGHNILKDIIWKCEGDSTYFNTDNTRKCTGLV